MTGGCYLAADAAALGDAELVPKARALRPRSDTILQELDYDAELFQRMGTALQDAIYRLEGAGVRVFGTAAMNATVGLSQLSALVQIEAMHARAGRKA